MSFPAYVDQQDTGIKSLGDIPVHWGLKRLKDVATHNDEALGDDTPADAEFLYVDISSVDTRQGIHSKEEVVFKSAPSRARRIVRDGDVIVSTVRTYLKAIARVVEPEENLIVSTGFTVIRPSEQLEPSYAGFLLLSNYFIDEVISRSTGVSYPAINASDLVRIQVPVPPPDEQKAISSFLDVETSKIDGLVSEQRRLIELLKEKRQAVISHAVTKGLNRDAPMKSTGIQWLGDVPQHWEVSCLKHYVSTVNGFGFSSSDFQDEGVPFIRAGNIKKKSITPPTIFLPEEVVAKYGRVALSAGDIVISMVGSDPKIIESAVGQVGIIPESLDGAVPNQNVVILREDSRFIEKRYLFYVLCGTAYRNHLNLFSHKLANQSIISSSLLVAAKFAFPEKEEQTLVVAYLNEVVRASSQLIAEAERAVELLQERRTALISAAVTGKIDVRKHRSIAA